MWIVLVALVLLGEPQIMQGVQHFDTEEACKVWMAETVPKLLEELKQVDPEVVLVKAECTEGK